jgi:tetratricopeptide (TPR) repeat protein
MAKKRIKTALQAGERRRGDDSNLAAPSAQGSPSWIALVVVAAVALAARFVYVRVAADAGLLDGLFLDSQWYAEQAVAIRLGHGAGAHPYLLSPLYPYVLAAFTDATGSLHEGSVQAMQAVVGSATCVLVAVLAARIVGRGAGWIAGIASALFGPSIHIGAMVLVSCLQGFFLTLGVLLIVLDEPAASRKRAIATWLGAGTSLGIAAVLHPLSLAIAVVVILALWIAPAVGRRWRHERARVFRCALWLLAGLTLVIAPFTVRNTVNGGEFVLLSANSGLNFWIGNHAGASGLFHAPAGYDVLHDPVGKAIADQALAHTTTYSEASNWWRQRALDDVSAAPVRAITLLGKKLLLFAHPTEIPQLGESFAWFRDRAWPLRFPLDGRTVLILALLAPFAILLRGERASLASLRFPLVALGGYALAVALFFVTGRYRMPIMPIAIAIAAAGVVEGWKLFSRGAWTKSKSALLASVPILFFASSAIYSVDGGPLAIPESTGVEERHRGMALYQQSRFAEAAECYERALERGDDPVTRTNLANALKAMGRVDEAAQQYRLVLASHPGDGVTWYDYGNLLRTKLHDLRGALEAYRKATEASPQMAEAHFNLGATLLELDQPEDARAAIDAALQIAPLNASWRPEAERARVLGVMRITEKQNAGTPPR